MIDFCLRRYAVIEAIHVLSVTDIYKLRHSTEHRRNQYSNTNHMKVTYHPDDGGRKHLRNVGKLLLYYTKQTTQNIAVRT